MGVSLHSIQSQVFDLAAEDKAQAQRLHQALGQAFESRILPLIEQVFDELVGPEQTIELARVEVDVGKFDEPDLVEGILRQLPQALRLALSEQLYRLQQRSGLPARAAPAPSAALPSTTDRVQPTPLRQLDYLVHVLQVGRWPSTAPSQALRLTDLLQALLDAPPADLRPRLLTLLGQVPARRRLAQQLPTPLFWRLLAHLAPAAHEALTPWQPELAPALRNRLPAAPPREEALRELTWQLVYQYRRQPGAWRRLDQWLAQAAQSSRPSAPPPPIPWADLPDEALPQTLADTLAALATQPRAAQAGWLDRLGESAFWRLLIRRFPQQRSLWEDLARQLRPLDVPALREQIRLALLRYLIEQREALDATTLAAPRVRQALRQAIAPSSPDGPPPDSGDAQSWTAWLAQAQATYRANAAARQTPSLPSDAPLAHPPHSQAARDLVFHWLLAGALPWWAAPDQVDGPTLLRDLLAQQPQALPALWTDWQAVLSPAQIPEVAKRLRDLPAATQQALLLALLPAWGGFVLTLILAAEQVQRSAAVRLSLWRLLLRRALDTLDSNQALQAVLADWQAQAGADFAAALARWQADLQAQVEQSKQRRFRPLLRLLAQLTNPPDWQQRLAPFGSPAPTEEAAPPSSPGITADDQLRLSLQPPDAAPPQWSVMVHLLREAALPRGYTGLSAADLRAWWQHFLATRPAQMRALLREYASPRRRALLLQLLDVANIRALFAPFDATTQQGFFEAAWTTLGQTAPEWDVWLRGHALQLLLRPGKLPPNLIAYLRDLITHAARVSGQLPLALVQQGGDLATQRGGAAAQALLPTLRVIAEGLQRDSPAQMRAVPPTGLPEAADAPRRERDGSPPEDPIYVLNAGLVLLWPFWDFYFTQLALLTEQKQFRDLASQQRAVLLLQYLATGQVGAEEAHLPLNKILCNLPVDDPVPLDWTPTELELDLSDKLFGALKGRWPGAKDLDHDGIRGSFLLREGRLRFKGKTWNLRVDPKPYDLLLNSLPYSLSLLRLPWREELVHVEWR